MAILELNNVSKRFGEGLEQVDVLKNINLTVEDGEFVAIVGFSGSGKSTLINLMAGLEFPDVGEVTALGEPVTGPAPERAVCFQSYSL
ncbi:MAG: ATP-binding cassette domain-containing protein, partial [Pseudomonadota bacterium]